MAAVPNHARFPGPGDFSPPEDRISDVQWQEAVCRHADELVDDGMVSELVDGLADHSTWIALQHALCGRALHYCDRKVLESLLKLCQDMHDAVRSQCDEPVRRRPTASLRIATPEQVERAREDRA